MTLIEVDRETELCISIAARPGNLGAVLHNTGYRALGLNFVYKPCCPTSASEAAAAVRALGIRGCSVSMPFKRDIVAFIDELAPCAKLAGAVNTVANDGGKLIGYNTDVAAFEWLIESHIDDPNAKIVVLGGGGAARAALAALDINGYRNVAVCVREKEKHADLPFQLLDWDERNTRHADVLINATPVGMSPSDDQLPISKAAVQHYATFVDYVAIPIKSKLIRVAQKASKTVIPGYLLSFHQALKQFEIYTGVEAPAGEMFERYSAVIGLTDQD